MSERRTDLVVVGRKPVLRYALAVLTSFNRGSTEVVVRGRGRSVAKCVDVVNTLRNSFYRDLRIEDVKLGTDQLVLGDRTVNVSFIEIRISRGGRS
ncbi:MAG: RNA-binding protein [Nitrososphaerota archaeon]|nr:RNA-binding protein [Candidatus Calditenuis fumarioli]